MHMDWGDGILPRRVLAARQKFFTFLHGRRQRLLNVPGVRNAVLKILEAMGPPARSSFGDRRPISLVYTAGESGVAVSPKTRVPASSGTGLERPFQFFGTHPESFRPTLTVTRHGSQARQSRSFKQTNRENRSHSEMIWR